MASIHFITDLIELDSNLLQETFEKNLIDHKKKDDFIFPPLIFQSFASVGKFKILIHLARKTLLNDSGKMNKIHIKEINKDYFSGDFCLNENYEINFFQMWQESNVTGCSILMSACHVFPTNDENTFESKKEIIILTKGEKELNQNEIIDCFKSKVEISGLNFSEFNVKGLCICDYLNYYLNECEINNENLNDDDCTSAFEILGLSGILLLFLIIIAAIYDYLILK